MKVVGLSGLSTGRLYPPRNITNTHLLGHAVGQYFEALCYKARRSWIRFPVVPIEFFIDMILPAALWPWGRLASNRNEYHKYFLDVKAAGV